MKLIKFLLRIYLFWIFTLHALAHQELVHQYIVREAYQVLRSQIGFEVPTMGQKVGTTEQGTGPFIPGGLLVIGAYREDRDDIVWGYGTVHYSQSVSVTHFWDPDNGDGSHFCTHWCVLPQLYCYENAYEKAQKFIYGGYELKVYYPGTGITESYDAPAFLPDYYKTGRIFYRGYYDSNGAFVSRNYWVTSSMAFRDRVVWEILGRVAHLLADVGVPAHAHNDQHEGLCGGTDTYEVSMGSVYGNWSHTHALAQGGIVDVVGLSNPLKYLFYTTAQIADHFPSDDVGGDNSFGINEPFSNYPPLQNIINSLGSPPSSVNVSQIANTAFVYSIRATAGLLYWFALETDLLANTLVQNSFGGGRVRVGGTEYSSGYRTPAWGSPSPITLEAIDQVYNGCNYRFTRWRKLQNGNEVGSWTSRTITVTPEANTTYEAVFETLQPTATMSWQSPWLTDLYWNEGGDFRITLNPANPCAVYGWELQSRQLLRGTLQWGSAHEVTGVYFGGLGNVATLRNDNFQFYNNGGGADSLLRVRCRITVCGNQWYSYGGIFAFKPRNRPAGGGGGGGGCPFVYSWNGEAWVVDNNILPQSAGPGNEGRDVTDFYQLFYKPIVENDRYWLAIAEYEKEHSFLDQVKLLVVDHDPHASITVDDSGTVLQFLKPAALIDAQLDSQRVLEQLSQLDNVKVEVTEDDTMRLWFDNGGGQYERGLLVIGQTERKGGDPPVRIVVKNGTGQEGVTFTSFRLRRNPSYAWALVGVSDTSVQEIEIEWKKDGEVDYTQLSRKIEFPFVVQQAELLNAVHYAQGDVTEQLRLWDENYVELMPEEWIALEFNVPPMQPGIERSFILVSRGRYEAPEGLKVAKGNTEATPTSTTQTQEKLPKQFKIAQNYPNPFNPSTIIKFGLPEQQRVRLVVYDFLGRAIRTLRDEEMPAGYHEVIWDGKDEHGLDVASGLYFYRLTAGAFMEARKMVLVR